MTVRELIELLETQDPDLEVVLGMGLSEGWAVVAAASVSTWTPPETGVELVEIEGPDGN